MAVSLFMLLGNKYPGSRRCVAISAPRNTFFRLSKTSITFHKITAQRKFRTPLRGFVAAVSLFVALGNDYRVSCCCAGIGASPGNNVNAVPSCIIEQPATPCGIVCSCFLGRFRYKFLILKMEMIARTILKKESEDHLTSDFPKSFATSGRQSCEL